MSKYSLSASARLSARRSLRVRFDAAEPTASV
jgi:hypothetical protein